MTRKISIEESFADFFAETTEESAAEDQKFIAEKLAAVDVARATSDWETLRKLGFAQKVDGPSERLYRWEFNQYKYDALAAELKLTPKQLAAKRNAADW